MKIAIGIATAGRRDQLALTLQQLALQAIPPNHVFVCPAAPEDFDSSALPDAGAPIVRVASRRGLCQQRNAIIGQAIDCDVLLFIDDDFYLADDYLQHLQQLFAAHPDIAITTSHPEHDGARGPGLTHDFAVQVLQSRAQRAADAPYTLVDTYGGYGCNLAVRCALLREHNLRFDEHLPLYAWLEDIDFSRRVAPFGRIVASNGLYGVHLGTKRGRTSGVQLGYSQVANPAYLMRKGSLSAAYGVRQIVRNVAKNLLLLARPEPWVDRRGRAKGNALALADLLLGRADPARILAL